MVLHFPSDVLLALNVAINNPRPEMSPAAPKLGRSVQSFSEEQRGQVLVTALGLKGDVRLGHGTAAGVGLAAFAVVGTLLFERCGSCSQYIAGARGVGHVVVCTVFCWFGACTASRC